MSVRDKTDIHFLEEAGEQFKVIKKMTQSNMFARQVDLLTIGAARALKYHRTRRITSTTGTGWKRIIKDTIEDFKHGAKEIHFILRTIALAISIREEKTEETFKILYDLPACARIVEQLFSVEWNRPDGIKALLTEDKIDDQFLVDIKDILESSDQNITDSLEENPLGNE